MLAQSIISLGQGIYYIIGLIFVVGVLSLIIYATWTALRAWRSESGKRQAWAEYRRETFRPDGKPYPRHTPGVCTDCGRPHDKIYHPHSGPKLCPPCYDRYWRTEEHAT